MEAVVDKVYEHKDKSVSSSGYSHDGRYRIVSEARMKNPVTREEIKNKFKNPKPERLDWVLVNYCPERPEYQGKYVLKARTRDG